MNKDSKETIWNKYCAYCGAIIKVYSYQDMLFNIDLDKDYKWCNKRHEFLDKLRGQR